MNRYFTPLVTLTAIAIFSTLSFSGSFAHAQNVTKISQPKVKTFYNDLAGLFKKPYPHFLTAYADRLHPDLEFTTQTTINITGQGPIETPLMTLNKDDLMKNAEDAYNSAKNAQLSTNIESVTIAEDGKSATVQTESRVKNMAFPTTDGGSVNADSIERCDDMLVLDAEGSIQVRTSVCESDITIFQ